MLVVVIGVLMMNQVNTYETDVVDRGAISFYCPLLCDGGTVSNDRVA